MQLSSSIFEWDEQDVNLLMSAKRVELQLAGLNDPSNTAVRKALTVKELARHCRRRTRGVEETTSLIESMLLSLSQATDTLGVPLFREEMNVIWEEQRHHVPCIQDPPNIPLYTLTGHVTKGGVRLPTLQCARGSTSLESFHLHLARFIPGSSASAVHYQAYLLEGITRWNNCRAAAAVDASSGTLRSFDSRLQQKVCNVQIHVPYNSNYVWMHCINIIMCACNFVCIIMYVCTYYYACIKYVSMYNVCMQVNELSSTILGKKVLPNLQPSAVYTGELFGVEYLLAQSGMTFKPTSDEDLAKEIDEGFGDIDSEEEIADPEAHDDDITVALPPDSESEDEVHQTLTNVW